MSVVGVKKHVNHDVDFFHADDPGGSHESCNFLGLAANTSHAICRSDVCELLLKWHLFYAYVASVIGDIQKRSEP